MQRAKVLQPLCSSGKNPAISHYYPCVYVLYMHVCVYNWERVAGAEVSKQLKIKQEDDRWMDERAGGRNKVSLCESKGFIYSFTQWEEKLF